MAYSGKIATPEDMMNRVNFANDRIRERDSTGTEPVPHCSLSFKPEESSVEYFKFEGELRDKVFTVTRIHKKTGKDLGEARLQYLSNMPDTRARGYFAIMKALEDEQILSTPLYLSPKSNGGCGRFVVVETPDVSLRQHKRYQYDTDMPLMEALGWGSKALALLERLTELEVFATGFSIDTVMMDNGNRLMYDSTKMDMKLPGTPWSTRWLQELLSELNSALATHHTPSMGSPGLPMSRLTDSPRRRVVQFLADRRDAIAGGPKIARKIINTAFRLSEPSSRGRFYRQRRIVRRIGTHATLRGLTAPKKRFPAGRSFTAGSRKGQNSVIHRYAVLRYLRHTGVVPLPLSLTAPIGGTTERTLVQSHVGTSLPSLPNIGGKWDYLIAYKMIEALQIMHSRGVYIDGPFDCTDVYWTLVHGKPTVTIDSDRLVFGVIENETMCIQNVADVAKILDQMVARWTTQMHGQAVNRQRTSRWTERIAEYEKRFRFALAHTAPGKDIDYAGMVASLKAADAAEQLLP